MSGMTNGPEIVHNNFKSNFSIPLISNNNNGQYVGQSSLSSANLSSNLIHSNQFYSSHLVVISFFNLFKQLGKFIKNFFYKLSSYSII